MRLEPVVITRRDLPYLRVYYPSIRTSSFVHIGPLDYIPDHQHGEARLVWRRLYRRSKGMTARLAHFKVSIALAGIIEHFGTEVLVRFDCQDTGGMDPIVGSLSRALQHRNMILRPEHFPDLAYDAVVLLRRMSGPIRERYHNLEVFLSSIVERD